MSISKRQLAANRANAQKSTGPRSAEAKEKVSQNATKHGLCGHFQVLKEVESQERYDAFLNQLIADEQPVGQAEIELVVKMAEHTWLSKRALRMQDLCFVPMPKTPEQAKNGEIPVGITVDLENCVRYHAAHDRAYQRASAELQKRKKERHLAEIGIASQKRAERQEERHEKQQAQRDERHKTAVATDKKRLELAELKALTAANGVAKLLDGLLPPETSQIAA